MIEIDVISTEQAGRLIGVIKEVASWEKGPRPLAVQSLYDSERAHLKFIITGDLPQVRNLIETINVLAA